MVVEGARARMDDRKEILDGMLALRKNYPPKGKAYSPDEARRFVEIVVVQHLETEAPSFTRKEREAGRLIDTQRFPPLRSVALMAFFKFYTVKTRKPRPSDVIDLLIMTSLPYVDTFITERNGADQIRRSTRVDGLLAELEVATLRNLA